MRLPKSGAFFSSLYEYEISLKDVILKLDLNPLSEKDEAFVRTTIGHAIGEWSKSEGGHKEPGAKLKVADVRQSLRRLVSQLDEASKTLAAAGGGFHEAHERA